jgi:hypothetical protein
MRRLSVRIALAACLLPVSSCAALKCEDYRHLTFEPGPNISVMETSVPPLSGLRDVKPFPVSYVLKRSGYQIVARIYQKDHGVSATLSVDAEATMTLKIADVSAHDGPHCLVAIEQNGSVKFGWSCKAEHRAKQRIAVAVIDASGAQVAVEEFPFSVVTNGRSCLKDGI